jgi:hypothetical protein
LNHKGTQSAQNQMTERFQEMKRMVIGLGLVCLAAEAAAMRMTWTLLDGKVATETRLPA